MYMCTFMCKLILAHFISFLLKHMVSDSFWRVGGKMVKIYGSLVPQDALTKSLSTRNVEGKKA